MAISLASMSLELPAVVMLLLSPLAGSLAAAFLRTNLPQGPAERGSANPESFAHNYLCSRGKNPAALLYPAVVLAFFACALWASLAGRQELISGILLGWALTVLFVFDILAFVLPDFLTYSLLASGLALASASGPGSLYASAAGTAAGGGFLLLMKFLYGRASGREGLGMGDVKLFAAAGAWAGAEGLPQILLISSILGLIYAALPSSAPRRLQKVPFGAGLCVGIWITWLYGPVFVYEHLLGLAWHL